MGGSIASSFHGIPRSTNDVDIIAALYPKHIKPFSQLLESEFYADPDQMLNELAAGRSFNVVHLATSYKFDIFPLQPADLIQAGLPGEGSFVATAEDTLLEKLNWCRQGGAISERQWNDVLSILNVQGPKLDEQYLERWAPYLKVHDLLQKARFEAKFAT